MKKKVTILKIATGSAIILLALYMLYASIALLPENERWWKENSIQATGIVVRLRETYRNRTYCYYPVIEFTAENGKEYSFSPYDCYSRHAFAINQRVAVRYGKDDPAQAFIDSKSHDRATYIAIYCMCGLMVAAGTLLIVSGIKKAKNEEGSLTDGETKPPGPPQK